MSYLATLFANCVQFPLIGKIPDITEEQLAKSYLAVGLDKRYFLTSKMQNPQSLQSA